MKLFECSWQNKNGCFIRYFDNETKKVGIENIDNNYEWFEPSDSGNYRYLLNQNIKFKRVLGNWKRSTDQYGVTDPIYRHIRDKYWKNNRYNMIPRIWYLDIETRSGTVSEGFPDPMKALEPVSLIQFFDSEQKIMFILGLRDFKEREDYKLEYKIKYLKFRNEIEMLKGFIKLFNYLDPLIIYAWNGNNFDYPYLINRCINIDLPNPFTNHGNCEVITQINNQNKSSCKINCDGHVFFDMIEVYKQIVLEPRTSYSLDNIAFVELNDRKVVHTEYLDFDSFYTGKNYQISSTPYEDTVREEIRQLQIKKANGEDVEDKLNQLISFQFVYYGIYDVYLLKKLDDKIMMTGIFLQMSSMMGCQLSDMLGTVKKWSRYICNIAFEKGLVSPKRTEHNDPNIDGGFVRDPLIGKFTWVLSADVNSMYPLLAIAAFNMSPETLIPTSQLPSDLREIILKYFNNQDENARAELPDSVWGELSSLLKRYNVCVAINGAVFRRDKLGIIPDLIFNIYTERKKFKKLMLKYHAKQENLKKVIPCETVESHDNELRDPLEYSDKQLSRLNKTSLDSLIEKCEYYVKLYNVKQHVLKILMNSLYGAIGNKTFLFFNEKLAQAITGNGRFFIKMLANNIETRLQELKPFDGKYLIYGDTDSVDRDSIIHTDKGDYPIKEIYNFDGKEEEYKKGKFIKTLSKELKTPSVNDNLDIEYKPIKYVMKHKVYKKMVKIKIKDREVVITNDHSIKVLRDNKLIDIKPLDILKTDLICYY